MDWITHEEDVWFDFRGDHPEQLTTGRYYRGTIDGIVDFGVFVDLAPGVTGLLHRNELPNRLESYDWEVGDTLFVQVNNVRDNGDIDLGWSIRQQGSGFRGARVHDPGGDADGEAIEDAGGDESGPVRTEPEQVPNGGAATETREAGGSSGGAETAETAPTADAGSSSGGTTAAEPESVGVADVDDAVGDRVRFEGEVTDVRQTGGPTVFEVRDATGAVDCAAFVEPGVRAYPDVEVGDAVRIEGTVERHRGEVQIETEDLTALSGEDAEAVTARLADAMTERARPERVEALAGYGPVEALEGRIGEAATAIRRAVMEPRPVLVRHPATADGHVAGAAIERAVLALIEAEHDRDDAAYHYVDRRPLDDAVYGMNAATDDLTGMLEDRERHGEKLPLVVFAGVGGTVDSRDGLDLLGLYGVERVVLDAAAADAGVGEACEVLVDPAAEGVEAGSLSAGALAATLAAAVRDDARADLEHLPAVSYWTDVPGPYATLAEEAGYGAERTRELREAIALEAYYQSYDAKRELIADLLFGEADEGRSLAGHVSEQFREKLEAEVDTAEANLERRDAGGVAVTVLDADAYAHQYDFPPTPMLVGEIHRRHAGDGPAVTVGLASDELYVRSTAALDVDGVASRAAEAVPAGGVTAVGIRQGRIEFVPGEREAVSEAVVEAAVEQTAGN